MRSNFAFLLILVLAGTVHSQNPLTIGKPSDVLVSEAGLEAAARLYQEAVARDDLRGVVLLVARKGRIILHEAYGWRDEAKALPMQKDSLFRMASNTKAMVAAAALTLVDKGKLRLDDPVHKHIKAFDTERGRAITVRHLMTHTSGLRIRPIFLSPLVMKSEKNPTAPNLQVEVARFGKIGAEKEPGKSFSYNNPGYNTLAAMVEVASGMNLATYLLQCFYIPLGMQDSCNHESKADHERMSAIFRRSKDKQRWNVGWRPGDAPDYPFCRGSGGMITTARDFAVFCQMYLDGGSYAGKRILSRKLVDMAMRNQTGNLNEKSGYGFGWFVSREDETCFHGGSDGTWAWIDPKLQLVGLILTQSPGGKNPSQRFKKLVTEACKAP